MKRCLALAVVVLLLMMSLVVTPVSAWSDDVVSLPADVIPEDEYTDTAALLGIGAVVNGVSWLPAIETCGRMALKEIQRSDR